MTLREIELRRTKPVSGGMSLRRAWQTMREEKVPTLCVADEAGKLEGLITLDDVSTANLDGLDNYVLQEAGTGYENVLDTLDGTMLSGDPAGKVVEGRIIVGAGSADQIQRAIHKGDIVVVSNRSIGYVTAIEAQAGCLVVCTGVEVSRAIRHVAEEQDCLIIGTPHNVFATAQIISQAAPVRHYMHRDDLMTFTLDTPVEEAARIAGAARHRYFPVLDEEGRCRGLVSHRNLLNAVVK